MIDKSWKPIHHIYLHVQAYSTKTEDIINFCYTDFLGDASWHICTESIRAKRIAIFCLWPVLISTCHGLLTSTCYGVLISTFCGVFISTWRALDGASMTHGAFMFQPRVLLCMCTGSSRAQRAAIFCLSVCACGGRPESKLSYPRWIVRKMILAKHGAWRRVWPKHPVQMIVYFCTWW